MSIGSLPKSVQLAALGQRQSSGIGSRAAICRDTTPALNDLQGAFAIASVPELRPWPERVKIFMRPPADENRPTLMIRPVDIHGAGIAVVLRVDHGLCAFRLRQRLPGRGQQVRLLSPVQHVREVLRQRSRGSCLHLRRPRVHPRLVGDEGGARVVSK